MCGSTVTMQTAVGPICVKGAFIGLLYVMCTLLYVISTYSSSPPAKSAFLNHHVLYF